MLVRQRKIKKPPLTAKGCRNIAGIVLILCIGVLFALFTVWVRVQIFQIEYEISKANDEQRELLQSQKWMKVMIASLRSPERIEPIARANLGLKAPERRQIRWVK